MWIQVEHSLVFSYSDYVSESRMELRIEPRSTLHQSLRSFALAVGPPTRVHRYTDWNGNVVHHFAIGDYHERIEILGNALVETHPNAPALESLVESPAPREALGAHREWTLFAGPVVRSDGLEAFAAALPVRADAPLGEQVSATAELIKERIDYVQGVTDYQSTTDHLLESKAGVCQDFAHLQIALLRLRGIPSRYVSGYLHLGTGQAAESHAWIEVYAGDQGWISFDPTHARVPNENYITIGWGRDYDDVAPNRGVYRGSAREELAATVRTRASQPHDIVDLHEAIAQIDVPVFREIPSSRARDATRDAPPIEQQQQQQQQQEQQRQQQLEGRRPRPRSSLRPARRDRDRRPQGSA